MPADIQIDIQASAATAWRGVVGSLSDLLADLNPRRVYEEMRERHFWQHAHLFLIRIEDIFLSRNGGVSQPDALREFQNQVNSATNHDLFKSFCLGLKATDGFGLLQSQMLRLGLNTAAQILPHSPDERDFIAYTHGENSSKQKSPPAIMVTVSPNTISPLYDLSDNRRKHDRQRILYVREYSDVAPVGRAEMLSPRRGGVIRTQTYDQG